MPTPLSEAFASVLRSDSTAALAALMVIANAHREIFAWAARMLGAEPPAASVSRRSRTAMTPRRETLPPKAKPPRAARKPRGGDAYHARSREARDCDDRALVQAMRGAPEGSIGDWPRSKDDRRAK
jgi:hypothetical protein